MVCPYDWSVPGGVQTHVSTLATYFRDWGHDVTVFAPASKPEDVSASDCVVIGRPRSFRTSGSVQRITFSRKSKKVEAALGEGAFDVVHLHEPLMPLLPYYFLRHSQAVNIGTFHAARDNGHRLYSYSRPVTRRWFRKLDGKIAVSPAAVSLVSRYFDGYFNVIPNGIDFAWWSAERTGRPEFADGKKTILFVGRPEKRKGLKYALRAFAELRERRDDIRLVVVGAGDFHRYERAMHDVEDVVFRANVPYDELPTYHASADVFCAPNTGNESQGYVLMEAMAAGVPTVASNIEGFAGVITDGVDGVLVKPKDAGALARAVDAVLGDQSLALKLSAAGRARAATYAWDKVARRVLSYYERLVYEREQVAEAARRRIEG
ncbi:MAG: glycosyltransferase family 4 protein [Dehalococcoidia bacterium]|nr:glycosyltransferase family 4 protein [Dehalococcoidia bacterium]